MQVSGNISHIPSLISTLVPMRRDHFRLHPVCSPLLVLRTEKCDLLQTLKGLLLAESGLFPASVTRLS